MDVFTCMRQRHSYRGKFTTEPIPRTDLERIIVAGTLAPSGCNRQTTEFIGVDDPALIAEIRPIVATPAAQCAQAYIFCVINKTPPQSDSYEIEDCAAAVQNMLLAIEALNYATVWIDGALRSNARAEEIAKILKLPPNKIIRVMLPLGRALENADLPQKLLPEKRISWNEYDK